MSKEINVATDLILEDINDCFRQIESQMARSRKLFNKLVKLYGLTENGECEDESDLELLNLNNHTIRVLKRNHLYTIQDILDYPRDEWLKINGFGHLCKVYLEDAMKKAGHSDFEIEQP